MTPQDNSELRAGLARIHNRQYDREITIAEAIEESLALLTAEREKLLDELEKELAMAERLAWSDNEGFFAETAVLRNNMKGFIASQRRKTE